MNGIGAPFAPPPPGSAWQEHRTPDGRSYYYNSLTKVTQWTKPEELMSPAEVCRSALRPRRVRVCVCVCVDADSLLQRALANQPWKEYTAEGGRKYWYNTETKQSTWEMPDVYKRALGIADGTPTTPA